MAGFSRRSFLNALIGVSAAIPGVALAQRATVGAEFFRFERPSEAEAFVRQQSAGSLFELNGQKIFQAYSKDGCPLTQVYVIRVTNPQKWNDFQLGR